MYIASIIIHISCVHALYTIQDIPNKVKAKNMEFLEYHVKLDKLSLDGCFLFLAPRSSTSTTFF